MQTNTSSQSKENTEKQIQDSVELEKKRRELWIYLGVGIVSIEVLITVASLLYGFIMATPNPQGMPTIRFPLLLWAAGMICVPAVLIALVHYAGVGLFESQSQSKEAEEEWQARLPERLQKIYLLLKGAPVFVVLLIVILVGAALATIDGALTAFGQVASALTPYIPYFLGTVAVILCCFFVVSALLKYKSHKLHEEFAFRREVFEKTGVVIVDKNSYALPQGSANQAIALEANNDTKALPTAEEITIDATPTEHNPNTPIVDITPEEDTIIDTSASSSSSSSDNKA